MCIRDSIGNEHVEASPFFQHLIHRRLLRIKVSYVGYDSQRRDVYKRQLLLRSSEFKGEASYGQVIDLAKGAVSKDPEGYRAEFVRLVKLAQSLDTSKTVAKKDE